MGKEFNLAGRTIGPDHPPFIIAEIGANHNGDMGLCRKLIDAAKACGADAVKFQSWSKDSLISRAEYERQAKLQAGPGETLAETVARLQLSAEQHAEIAHYCRNRRIIFLSTCFSAQEADLLEKLEVPAFKIASMDANNLPLLAYVARKGRPVILSTGMAFLGEIERAVGALQANGAASIALLHCVAVYPPAYEAVNLRNLATLRAAFGLPVGFSDHTQGIAVPLAATALGACIIEKHFTLDKCLEGWDHAISADPAALKVIVEESRHVFAALGSTVRTLGEAELSQRKSMRRSAVLRRSVKKGEKVRAEDLDFKRPGTGIHPDELPYVVGRTWARDLKAEEEVSWPDFL